MRTCLSVSVMMRCRRPAPARWREELEIEAIKAKDLCLCLVGESLGTIWNSVCGVGRVCAMQEEKRRKEDELVGI